MRRTGSDSGERAAIATPSPRLVRTSTVLLVLVVLGAVCFQGWVLVESRKRDLAFMSLRSENRAQATAHEVRAVLRRVDLVLLDLREDIDLSALNDDAAATAKADAMHVLLQEHVARIPQLSHIHITNAQGSVVYSSTETKFWLGDRPYFQKQRDAQEDALLVPPPMVGRARQDWMLLPSRRLVTKEGRFAGVVVAAVDTYALGAVMKAVDQQQWVLALFDSERHLVARTPERPDLVGLVEQAVPLARWSSSSSHTTFRAPALGELTPHLWAAQRIEDLPLFTVTGISEDRTLKRWRNDLRMNLLVDMLLVGGLMGILVLQRRNVRAARDLELLHQSLASSEAYFRAVFDSSPDPVAVVHDGKVIDANDQYRALFGIDTTTKTPPWAHAPERQPSGSVSATEGKRLAEAALVGRLQRVEWQCQRSDGSLFDAELTLTMLPHEGKRLVVAVVRDLTEKRLMEQKLSQAQKLDALGQLAGGVAHDFNNMLMAILGSAELLSEQSQSEEDRALSNTISLAAERASQLTKKLLAFARKGKVLSTPTDAHAVVADAVALLSRTIDRRIELTVDLAASHAVVVADPAQLQNALMNLGLNARDAMPEGGKLTYTTGTISLASEDCHLGTFRVEPGEYLTIEVKDTGSGIPKEILPRVFDPFFTTKDIDKGTGLGLASVYGTMASHHGAVTIESVVGEGTTFRLFLPLTSRSHQREALARAVGPQGSGCVLLVDDEDLVRTASKMQLESLGYSVIACGAVEEAMAAFQGHHAKIRAALVDMVMPGASGVQVAERMRAIDAGVPVILVSGFSRSGQIDELIGKGCAGFLAKPFGRKELGDLLLAKARIVP